LAQGLPLRPQLAIARIGEQLLRLRAGHARTLGATGAGLGLGILVRRLRIRTAATAATVAPTTSTTPAALPLGVGGLRGLGRGGTLRVQPALRQLEVPLGVHIAWGDAQCGAVRFGRLAELVYPAGPFLIPAPRLREDRLEATVAQVVVRPLPQLRLPGVHGELQRSTRLFETLTSK